ncbi:hypothetical protein AB0D49_34260 [Streptomyces sp. NPDC048290]|uniref:hypothetical protein n=1 Tax=Streptomyces sp. NPDC048290 TaxID=3155811 RepID=UPI003434E389
MSRGEEFDEPIMGDDHFAVVIAGDGSATIDGGPVTIEAGQTADAAVLDALHDRAHARGGTVTATISDPSAAYVAHIEVAPDGSSRLLEQREAPTPDLGPVIVPVDVPELHGDEDDDDAYEEEDEDDDDEADGHGDFAVDWTKRDVDDDAADDDPGESSYTLPEPPPLSADEDDDPSQGRYDEDDDDGYDDPDDRFEDDHYDDAPEDDRDHDPAPAPEPAPVSALHRSLPPALVRKIDRKERARQSDDEYTPSGLLQRPLIVAPAALAVAGIVVVSLVVVGSGGSGDDPQQASARTGVQESGSPSAQKDLPAPTFKVEVTPPSLTASPSPSTSPKPSPSTSERDPQGEKAPPPQVTVTATEPGSVRTVTAKPKADTAASAVKRLAKSDPGGRHICYRAFVSGIGWQKPVCDGTIAGTTKQNRAIKALNLAVYNTGGTAANAVRYDSDSTDNEGDWQPSWTAVTGDGRDIYIGDTSIKYISGMALNVGSGRVCATAKVKGYDWGTHGCADARPAFAFNGSMENQRYLEAVTFTVPG